MSGRWVALMLVLPGLVVLGLPSQSYAHPRRVRRADLVVTAASTQSKVALGGELKVRATVRNKGNRRAPTSRTGFFLSKDRSFGRDLRIGKLRTPALRPARKWTGSAKVRIPASTSAGSYYVLACADVQRRVRERRDGNNCRATGRLRVEPPASSHTLIDQDVAAGVLSDEQGLVYKVFSDYVDPRLPKKYAGTPDGLEEGALTEAALRWSGLSADAQEQLRPFLIPPFYAGSHWSPSDADAQERPAVRDGGGQPWCVGDDVVEPLFHRWKHLDTADGTVRVWWMSNNDASDSDLATHLVDVLDSAILPALSTLMGRGPKPDADGLCDGGSAALDIALVDASTATTYADDPCGPEGTSAHMLFPRSAGLAGWEGLDPYLAHEVMHAIQFAMPVASSCAALKWVREMTAEWVQDYVTDPEYGIGLGPDDTEFQAAKIYLTQPETSLDELDPPPHHSYGDYLLPFWAERQSPGFVAAVWANAEHDSPLAAVDHALPGGFRGSWPDFAAYNWNDGPVDHYKQWDGLTQQAAINDKVPVPLDGDIASGTVKVDHLAATYYELEIKPTASELELTNDLHGDQSATITAILYYDDGTSTTMDVSGEKTVICLHESGREVTRVVLVFSNSDMLDSRTFHIGIGSKSGCGCPDTQGARARSRAAVAGDSCGAANVTFSFTDTYSKDDNAATLTGTTELTGSMQLFMAAEPGRAGSFVSTPDSRYAVTSRGHSVRTTKGPAPCESVVDITDAGSGLLEDGAAGGHLDEDSGQFDLVNLIVMPTTWTQDVSSCLGPPSHHTQESFQSPPVCPPRPGETDFYYELDATGEPSTYAFHCTGSADYQDGSGVIHHVTSKVDVTLALPGLRG